MASYKKAIDLLKNNQKIAVFMHINPDGDCISSALSLYLFLKKCGKDVVCFSQGLDSSVISDKFKFLPSIDAFNSVPPQKEYDLCVGMDVSDASRFGETCFRLFMKGKNNLVIDHHIANNNFAKNVVREESAASTTQILYKLLVEYDENLIDKDIATCLYTGLVTDSGCFSFSCTTKETHLVAAKLLTYGIDSTEITRIVMKDTPISVFMLKNRVLSRAEFFDGNNIGLINFTLEDYDATGTTEQNTEGIINSILDVQGVEVAISISAIAEKSYKVSFRSKHKVDASACARCFGGGGHFHASGCRVYGYYEDVKNKIIEAVREISSYA